MLPLIRRSGKVHPSGLLTMNELSVSEITKDLFQNITLFSSIVTAPNDTDHRICTY